MAWRHHQQRSSLKSSSSSSFFIRRARDCVSTCTVHCPASHRQRMNRCARIGTTLCLSWTLFFLLWGGTSSGKAWFADHVAKPLFGGEYKGGTPLICLAIPLLVAGTLSSSLWLRVDEKNQSRPDDHPWSSSAGSVWRRLYRNGCCSSTMFLMRGDATMPRLVSGAFLVVMLIYLAGALLRKLASIDDDTSTDWIVMEVGNVCGIAALIATGFILVPVTKFSPLVVVWGWHTSTAMALHQTMGRFIVVASVLHGILHSYRWVGIAGESYWTMIVPPRQCYSSSSSFRPTCHSSDTDCTCYDIFKNFAGVVAGLGLVAIGVSSLAVVRRNCYRLFYRIHVLASPLVLVAIVVHWNRSMLYMAGGVLYYTAMWAVTYVEERFLQRGSAGGRTFGCRSPQGVAVVSADRITPSSFSNYDGTATNISTASSSSACFLSLTIQADAQTVLAYRPTQYVKLQVPEISSVSHPFTVNRVPNEPQKLRLIIREQGPFTRALAQKHVTTGFEQGVVEAIPPRLGMQGFFGTETRLANVLQHDVVVMIAGGIGITTYLTLLHDTVEALQARPLEHDRRLQKIHLHWICREGHLIEYIQREYFDSLAHLVESVQGIHLSITIHKTGNDPLNPQRPAFSDVENRNQRIQKTFKDEEEDACEREIVGHPFRTSRFSIGSGYSYMTNFPAFLALSLVSLGGLEIIWYSYVNLQSKHEFFSRFWVVGLLGLYCLLVGTALNLFIGFCCAPNTSVEFAPIRSDEGVEMEEVVKCGPDTDDDFPINQKSGVMSISAGGFQRREAMRPFSMEEKQGRPSIHSLFHPLEECKYPAVFSCGPSSLMQDIKDKAIGRCSVRLQRCICGEARIALYEEAFEM